MDGSKDKGAGAGTMNILAQSGNFLKLKKFIDESKYNSFKNIGRFYKAKNIKFEEEIDLGPLDQNNTVITTSEKFTEISEVI